MNAGTLLYFGQLLDELPMHMVWATCTFCFAASAVASPSMPEWFTRGLLALFGVVVTVMYTTVFKHQPEFFIGSHGLLVFLLIVLVIKGVSRAPKDTQAELKQLVKFRSLLTYAVGLGLWNIDNLLCGHVRTARARLPSLLSPLLQLRIHMWWHIAQFGTYYCIVLLIMLDDATSTAKGGPQFKLGNIA